MSVPFLCTKLVRYDKYNCICREVNFLFLLYCCIQSFVSIVIRTNHMTKYFRILDRTKRQSASTSDTIIPSIQSVESKLGNETSHNQALIHWSGNYSSVSNFMLLYLGQLDAMLTIFGLGTFHRTHEPTYDWLLM